MNAPTREQQSKTLARMPPLPQWLLILLLSVFCGGVLELAGLPAAALIGPMLGGAIAGINGATVRIRKSWFAAAQAVIGILIASAIEIEIALTFEDDWPLFIGFVLATVAASSVLGWLISRWKILPGSTAVWGSTPGAATAMVLMAEAFGGDARLVAFMQYLRVLLVAITAAGIASFFVEGSGEHAATPAPFFPTLDRPALAATLLTALAGCFLGKLLRLPSPYFLGTMILATALHLGAAVPFQLPPWLLFLSYALIGWNIGLSFDRTIVRHALRALPQVIGAIIALIAFCAGLALLLSRLLGIDMLTAYLATSPGGMDSVAIIAAASSSVNMSFVMTMQMARFLFVLLLGPSIARLVARTVKD